MPSERIETLVFAAPGRDEAHARCFASIEASDIGQDYTVQLHPAGVSAREHWHATMLCAAAAASDYVLVLEDDVLVNRHILHNCRTWRWRYDPHFAAGWLYKPGGLMPGVDGWYTKNIEWYGGIAVLWKRAALAQLMPRAWELLAELDSNAWDVAISKAVLTGGYGIRMHSPSLAEHLDEMPSLMGHQPNYWFRTSRGTYDEQWQRAPGDRNGQFV